jgi:hypothetical protein
LATDAAELFFDSAVSHHSQISDAEWEPAYRAAWDSFRAPLHANDVQNEH